MRLSLATVLLCLAAGHPSILLGQDLAATRPLLTPESGRSAELLPSDTQVLSETGAIEQFLHRLDDAPPDWANVYGLGHHDPGHDDRLFALNRERDAKREGKPELRRKITFFWSGELSRYDQKASGFHVTIGPKFHRTAWGLVRFKPENLPGNLMAIPNPRLRTTLRRKLEQGAKIKVEVAMTGILIPEESIVYDFSHEEEGMGLVMPVVRIERMDYLLSR